MIWSMPPPPTGKRSSPFVEIFGDLLKFVLKSGNDSAELYLSRNIYINLYDNVNYTLHKKLEVNKQVCKYYSLNGKTINNFGEINTPYYFETAAPINKKLIIDFK